MLIALEKGRKGEEGGITQMQYDFANAFLDKHYSKTGILAKPNVKRIVRSIKDQITKDKTGFKISKDDALRYDFAIDLMVQFLRTEKASQHSNDDYLDVVRDEVIEISRRFDRIVMSVKTSEDLKEAKDTNKNSFSILVANGKSDFSDEIQDGDVSILGSGLMRANSDVSETLKRKINRYNNEIRNNFKVDAQLNQIAKLKGITELIEPSKKEQQNDR